MSILYTYNILTMERQEAGISNSFLGDVSILKILLAVSPVRVHCDPKMAMAA
jgi:hypothetical protein